MRNMVAFFQADSSAEAGVIERPAGREGASVAAESWTDLPGRLFVVSGPSGSGKSTLVRRLVAHPELWVQLSVSTTTRPARPGERDGVDYFFLSRDEFEAARDRGEFLEWAQVHGNLYGTPVAPVRKALATGVCELLEIDVQGGFQVRERVPNSVLVFIDVPSFSELEDRLRARASDDEAQIERRLAGARWEIEQAARYDHRVLNAEIDQAVDDLVAVCIQHGCQRPSPTPGGGTGAPGLKH
jgi:guanylate kinase